MPIIDAYAIRKKQEVMQDTWGHLRPKKGKVYNGTILFAYGEYGDIVSIRSDFGDLPSSPWFFSDLQEFIGKHCESDKVERGTIFLFKGTYQAKSDERRGIFKGKVETVNV